MQFLRNQLERILNRGALKSDIDTLVIISIYLYIFPWVLKKMVSLGFLLL